MALSSKSLAGPGYIILNVIRAMNIIALLAVVTASIVMLVKTFIVSKFFFFDAVSHVITALTAMFLTVSECSLFRSYYARNWPLLSPEHGFVMLAIAMIILGVNILGNLNKEATSQDSLGLSFWRIVIASGILVLVLGVFNFIASYVFRDKSRGITARNVRSHGAVAVPTPKFENSFVGKPLTIDTSIPNGSLASSSVYSSPKHTFPLRSPLKAFSPAVGALRRARDSILPSYYSSPNRTNADSPTKSSKKSKKGSVGPKMPINISAPLNVDTRFAHLVQPNLAHHPATKSDVEEGQAF